MEFDRELKLEILQIIEKGNAGALLDARETTMLFHYSRHKDDPEYAFVKEQLEAKKQKIKKRTKNTKKTAK